MQSMGISEFKAKCIAALKGAHRSGVGFIVTLRGRPLVRIEPIRSADRRRALGALRDRVTIHGDIVHSNFGDDWEMDC